MSVDFTNLDQKVTDIGTAITAGFDAVGKEVLETAELVKDLRDKVGAGVDAETIQAHLDSITDALEAAAESADAKSAAIAASLDAIQNPPIDTDPLPETPTES